jgi:hypothetical protein
VTWGGVEAAERKALVHAGRIAAMKGTVILPASASICRQIVAEEVRRAEEHAGKAEAP